MAKLPRTTNREEMSAVMAGSGGLGGERLIEYNIFLTDAFTSQQTTVTFLDAPGPPDQIDGFTNDDSYRRSRHLLLTKGATTEAEATNLRENSLARQVNEKRDQPAVIRLIRRRRPEELAKVDPNEPRVPWVNLIPPNTKFFLEQVQENREEKVQVIDTFGEWIAFFFGNKPEVYSYTGTLLNASNHDWKNEFQENYTHFLRGTRAVENRATIILQYDDVMVEGYMLNCSISMNALADKAVPFTFNLLVMHRSPIDPRGMIGLRSMRSVGSEAELALFNDLQQALDLTQAGRVDELETFFLMREYFSGHYIPGAGTTTSRPEAGNMEAPTSKPPGTVGGTSTDPPASAPFRNGVTRSLASAGDFASGILRGIE